MKKTKFVTSAAIIAALYVVLSYVAHLLGLASGAIQVRLSEVLTVLPFFMPAAVPGLTIGCLITNLVTGCHVWDVVFGTLATLLGALGTYCLRKKHFSLAAIPPIFANTLIVPLVLRWVYGVGTPLWLLALSVFAGEFIACGLLGTALCYCLKKRSGALFKN